jgi:hypothetical protein
MTRGRSYWAGNSALRLLSTRAFAPGHSGARPAAWRPNSNRHTVSVHRADHRGEHDAALP